MARARFGSNLFLALLVLGAFQDVNGPTRYNRMNISGAAFFMVAN
jgi:hypothetical protein